jgi:hypothetical protein
VKIDVEIIMKDLCGLSWQCTYLPVNLLPETRKLSSNEAFVKVSGMAPVKLLLVSLTFPDDGKRLDECMLP